MPAPIVATVAFEIDFHDDNTDVDVTGDVIDYWVRTGTEYVPDSRGDLRIEGARGRVRLLNRDNKYDRRRYGSPYTEAELSQPHRFRMRINGDSVVYAWVEPPQHIDQKYDEIVEFRIFSENEAVYDTEYFYPITDNQTAVSFLDDLVESMGTTRHARSVISAVNMGAVEVRSPYRKVLDDFAKFIGGYVIEHADGSIVAISALETNNTNPRIVDTTFSYISLDGYRDVHDLSKVRNSGLIAHIGTGSSTAQVAKVHKYDRGVTGLSVSPTSQVGDKTTKSNGTRLPDGAVNPRNPVVWYFWGDLKDGSGQALRDGEWTRVVGTGSTRTTFGVEYYDIDWELEWDPPWTQADPAHSTAKARLHFEYDILGPLGPSSQDEGYYRNEASINVYGDRDLKLPTWFDSSTASSPAGTPISKWIDALSVPISFRQVELPFAQPTTASSNLLRDLRAGDICHVIVEDIDDHLLANHRMLLLGLDYRGGSNQLAIARLGLVDIPYQQTAGQFILDQSELDGDDTLG